MNTDTMFLGTADPWTTQGLGGTHPAPCTIKNPYTIFDFPKT